MNTTLIYDALCNRSYSDLVERELSSRVSLFLAPLACIIDIVVVYTIWRTEKLHNKCHLLMLSLSMAHAIYASQMVIWAVRVLIRIRDSTPLILPSWLCILTAQPQVVSYNAFMALGLNLAIDRFMCVLAPIFYRQIDTKRYSLITNLMAYTHTILIVLISVIGTDIYAMFDCENPAIFNYNTFGTNYVALISNIRAGLLAVLYISAACYLMVQYKKANLCGSAQKSDWIRRCEIRVFTAMSVGGAMAILMRLAESVPYFVSSQHVDARASVALRLVTRLAGYVEGMAHLVIYLVIDKGFRRGFSKMILEKVRRRNVVSPNGR